MCTEGLSEDFEIKTRMRLVLVAVQPIQPTPPTPPPSRYSLYVTAMINYPRGATVVVNSVILQAEILLNSLGYLCIQINHFRYRGVLHTEPFSALKGFSQNNFTSALSRSKQTDKECTLTASSQSRLCLSRNQTALPLSKSSHLIQQTFRTRPLVLQNRISVNVNLPLNCLAVIS